MAPKNTNLTDRPTLASQYSNRDTTPQKNTDETNAQKPPRVELVGPVGGDLSGELPYPQIAKGAIVNNDVNEQAEIATYKIAGPVKSIKNNGLGQLAFVDIVYSQYLPDMYTGADFTGSFKIAGGTRKSAVVKIDRKGRVAALSEVNIDFAFPVTGDVYGIFPEIRLGNLSVTSSKIATGAVTADKLGAGSVTTQKLATDAVTSEKLADNAVGSEHIQSFAVNTSELANLSVTTEKLANSSVTLEKLDPNLHLPVTVITGLGDLATQDTVSSSFLGNGSVTTEKLADLGDGQAKTYGVTGKYISEINVNGKGLVTAATASDFAIPADKITTGTLSIDRLPPVQFNGFSLNDGTKTLALNVDDRGRVVTISAIPISVSQSSLPSVIQAGLYGISSQTLQLNISDKGLVTAVSSLTPTLGTPVSGGYGSGYSALTASTAVNESVKSLNLGLKAVSDLTPTAGQKAALASPYGTPSPTNPYVLNDDTRLSVIVPQGRSVNTTLPLSGGGSLAQDRTLILKYSDGLTLSNGNLVVSYGASATSIGVATSGGSATTVSRSDHAHAHGIQTDGSLHEAATTVKAGFMSSTDKTKLNNLPEFSLATASPQSVGVVNAVGSGTAVALANHVHAHDVQTDGSLHALAVAGSSHGFMSSTDKSKLDEIGGTSTPSVTGASATVYGVVKLSAAPVSGTPTAVSTTDTSYIKSGTTAGGDLAGTYPNPTLKNLSPAVNGTYSTTENIIPTITVDAAGRVTAVGIANSVYASKISYVSGWTTLGGSLSLGDTVTYVDLEKNPPTEAPILIRLQIRHSSSSQKSGVQVSFNSISQLFSTGSTGIQTFKGYGLYINGLGSDVYLMSAEIRMRKADIYSGVTAPSTEYRGMYLVHKKPEDFTTFSGSDYPVTPQVRSAKLITTASLADKYIADFDNTSANTITVPCYTNGFSRFEGGTSAPEIFQRTSKCFLGNTISSGLPNDGDWVILKFDF